MTRRGATKTIILDYLRTVHEPRTVAKIRRYMRKMHKVSGHAVDTTVWRLHNEGLVERVGRGEYQIRDSAGRLSYQHKPPD